MKFHKRKQYDICVIDKNDDSTIVVKYLSEEDKARNADFYAIFLKSNTDEIIGKAAMTCYWKKKRRLYKGLYRQATVTLYDFIDNISPEMIKKIIKWVTRQFCVNITNFIMLYTADAPAFKETAECVCTIPDKENEYFFWLGRKHNFMRILTSH